MKILCTTDVHGAIFSHTYSNNSDTFNGLTRLSTLLKKERQNNNIILIDNGDILQGNPLNTYVNKNKNNTLMADALNYLNYDYFNLGNHDFNYGRNLLEKHINTLNAKCLTTNIAINHTIIGKTQIINIEGIKIGLIGAVTSYIPNWEKEDNLVGIDVFDVFETISKEVKKIRKDVDILIVVYHGGFERDLNTFEPTENLTKENIGFELTKLDIDILLSGHQHRSINQIVNNTLCLQATSNLKEVMSVEIKDNQIKAKLVELKDYERDLEFEKNFIRIEEEVQKYLDIVITSTDYDLRINDVYEAQKNKHPYISLLNQIQLKHYNADISFASLFQTSIGLSKDITIRDILSSYPFPNSLVLIEIDYKTLLEYLEQNATYWTKNKEINPKFLKPKLEIYNYDMGDGISYTIDTNKKEYNRVSIDSNIKDTYKMVVNNYRYSGGGNFYMMKNTKLLENDTIDVVDIIIEYLKSEKPLKINHSNNIRLL